MEDQLTKSKVRENLDSAETDRSGMKGFFEIILRKFRMASFLVALVPLYLMSLMAMAIAAAPGIYFFDFMSGLSIAWPVPLHYLGLGMGLCVMMLFAIRWKEAGTGIKLAVAVALGGALLWMSGLGYVITERLFGGASAPESIALRVRALWAIVDHWRDLPLLGVGPGRCAEVARQMGLRSGNLENEYVLALLSIGFIGPLTIALVGVRRFLLARAAKPEAARGGYLAIVVALFINFGTYNLFSWSSGPAIVFLCCFLVGGAVVSRENGTLIGMCGVVPYVADFHVFPTYGGRREGLNHAEVGLMWAISPEHQRQGYATEAAQLLIDYAFNVMRLNRIIATTGYDNAVSQGVMRKVGMRLEKNAFRAPPWMQVIGILDNRRSERTG